MLRITQCIVFRRFSILVSAVEASFLFGMVRTGLTFVRGDHLPVLVWWVRRCLAAGQARQMSYSSPPDDNFACGTESVNSCHPERGVVVAPVSAVSEGCLRESCSRGLFIRLVWPKSGRCEVGECAGIRTWVQGRGSGVQGDPAKATSRGAALILVAPDYDILFSFLEIFSLPFALRSSFLHLRTLFMSVPYRVFYELFPFSVF